jgi:hypothetical protein
MRLVRGDGDVPESRAGQGRADSLRVVVRAVRDECCFLPRAADPANTCELRGGPGVRRVQRVRR